MNAAGQRPIDCVAVCDAAPRYIPWHNLPPRLTPGWPLLWWLALDYLAAPGWLVVAIVAASTLFYVAELWRLFFGVSVDVISAPEWIDIA